MSREMAHKVIVPQKKIMSRSFLNSGTLIVKLLFEYSTGGLFTAVLGVAHKVHIKILYTPWGERFK